MVAQLPEANLMRLLLTLVALLLAGLTFAAPILLQGKSLLPITTLYVPPIRYVEPEEEIYLGHLGEFSKWSKLEILLHGPQTSARDKNGNPFRIVVDVTFVAPHGASFVVPAFYDGDGSGGYSGNVWKVRFSADTVGTWHFSSASSNPELAGYSGAFDVTVPQDCRPYDPGGLPDLSCTGRLTYEHGEHYLKFTDGGYWVKGGIDDPENFIGSAFDSWQQAEEAIDFIRERGVNSIYLITNNITPGDRNDTWPWLGVTASEAKGQSDRFDVVKLQEWDSFFDYVQRQGIVLHFVLDDDSGWNDYDHFLYYREMVARFGHHPALIWNIGEEANENYWDSEQIGLAELIRRLDPYDHPVTVHRKPRWPFLGEMAFDLTSIQPGDGAGEFTSVNQIDLNRIVLDHVEGGVEGGRPVPVMIDETARVRRVNEDTRFIMRSQILYPIYLAGGNYEMHYHDAYGQGGTLTIEQMGPMLQEMQYARRFLESVPFHEMESCNEILSDRDGNYCFGKAGEVYAIYTAKGAPLEVDLSAMDGELSLQWFNPRTGTFAAVQSLGSSRQQRLNPPGGREAAAIISRTGR